MSFPGQRIGEEGTPRTTAAAIVDRWREHLNGTGRSFLELIAGIEPEETDDGKVYVVPTPPGLEGDLVVVDMTGVNVNEPHTHVEGTREGHIPLLGSAVMSIGMDVIDMQRGMSVVVQPGTPHFTAPHPEDGYVVGVVSVPGYDPEHDVPVDLEDPPLDFNADLYWEKQLGFDPGAGPEE